MKIEKFEDLLNLREKLVSYLLYKKDKEMVYWPEINVLSQFIRRLLYKNTDDGFDWRQFPHTENMDALISKWQKWNQNN